MDTTFLWHDYETFGTDTRRDWPAQFAAIRTDADLNEVGEPMELYCQPPTDRLPQPEACLITGITPQECLAKGLSEHQFAEQINAAFSQAGTIGVGYNSIRFDDEVTRFLLWRNLLDPYAREWQNGCSRWDLLDVVRCAHALRPGGIEWPKNDAGQTSFRLEHLSAANGLAHEQAHDALSDVRATIALARLLRQHQPRLFDFCLGLRHKNRVAQELGLPASLHEVRPFLHVSGRFGAARGCMALMAPLAMHPSNRNQLLAWDLSQDPRELADLSADAIRARLFTPTADLPPGVTRLPIKGVHLNKTPIVISQIKTLRPELAERWGIDFERAANHLQQLRALPDLSAQWEQVFAAPEHSATPDVDEDLYGGFLSEADRRRLTQLRTLDAQELALARPGFDDERLPELLLRFRARNHPDSLSPDEAAHWLAHCQQRLMGENPHGLNLPDFIERIDTLAETHDDERSQNLLSALYDWAEHIAPMD